jgi:hypothetical protein
VITKSTGGFRVVVSAWQAKPFSTRSGFGGVESAFFGFGADDRQVCDHSQTCCDHETADCGISRIFLCMSGLCWRDRAAKKSIKAAKGIERYTVVCRKNAGPFATQEGRDTWLT